VVNINNVQTLTGFTPQQFADAASAKVGLPAGFVYLRSIWKSLHRVFSVSDQRNSYQRGSRIQDSVHECVGMSVCSAKSQRPGLQVDYYHKNIDHILGVRDTNLAFEARIPGHTGETVPSGAPLVVRLWTVAARNVRRGDPWITKRMSKRFTLEANYTWTHETDNALNSSLSATCKRVLAQASQTSMVRRTARHEMIAPL